MKCSFFRHKWTLTTLTIPGKIYKHYGISCKFEKSNQKLNLTWPYLTDLASPTLTLLDAPLAMPSGFHITLVLYTDTFCQIIDFVNYQNLARNILWQLFSNDMSIFNNLFSCLHVNKVNYVTFIGEKKDWIKSLNGALYYIWMA
jgi:hypothetical protein